MTITRREVIQQVAAMLGGAALVGGDRLLAFSFDDEALARAMAQGAGTFSAADVALLDEIAETILPETSTPGAKAAKTGAFMALMVTDVYTAPAQQVFRDGMRSVEEACRRLKERNLLIVVVTNQPDIARGTASWADVNAINDHLTALLPIDDVLVCPHDDDHGCGCRKPAGLTRDRPDPAG